VSTFEHIALQQSPPYGLNDPLTLGLPRLVNGLFAQLRNELRIVRLAVCLGFVGAVSLQAGFFSIFARFALTLDTFAIPSVTASAYCIIVGAVAMLLSRSLSAPEEAASLR
jgi:hypothetical protein